MTWHGQRSRVVSRGQRLPVQNDPPGWQTGQRAMRLACCRPLLSAALTNPVTFEASPACVRTTAGTAPGIMLRRYCGRNLRIRPGEPSGRRMRHGPGGLPTALDKLRTRDIPAADRNASTRPSRMPNDRTDRPRVPMPFVRAWPMRKMPRQPGNTATATSRFRPPGTLLHRSSAGVLKGPAQLQDCSFCTTPISGEPIRTLRRQPALSSGSH